MDIQQIEDCSVCYTNPGDDGHLECDQCSSIICLECCVIYFRHCKDEKEIPKCIKCKSTFYISNVRSSEDLLKPYLSCLKEYFTLERGEEVRKKFEINTIVNKMRQEKVLFINENFPKAIVHTVKLCMAKELKKIDKIKKEKLEKDQKQAIKKCFLMSCKGSLNFEYKCMSCQTIFCEKCERKIKAGHECKKEDLESMKALNETKKCPKCGIPSFKYTGCEMMTCPACHTNYHYTSGEITKHGNPHNSDVRIEKERKLNIVYHKELEEMNLLDLVIKIENHKIPNYKGDSRITNLLLKLESGESEQLLLELATEFEKGEKKNKKYREHLTSLVEIEELISEKKLTEKKLMNIIKRLKIK